MQPQIECIDTIQGKAYVIDSVFDDETLEWIDNLRNSIPLDSKRPTVDRRFFADGPQTLEIYPSTTTTTTTSSSSSSWPSYMDPQRPVAQMLEIALERSIFGNKNIPKSDNVLPNNECQRRCHVFRYQRFLEYHKMGSELDPHTDGNKVCEETDLTSTHTLLLYLTDCTEGGETVLLTKCSKDYETSVGFLEQRLEDDQVQTGQKNSCMTSNDPILLYATRPRRGRILVFPHTTPHAGAKVISLPKICLRAEVSLLL